MKRFLSFFLLLVLFLPLLSGCTSYQTKGYTKTGDVTNYVCLRIKDFGSVVIELYPDLAPLTVANFQSLVSSGYYNGQTFHRVAPGFVIQGGAHTGSGDAPTTIKGEFASNGVSGNTLSHTRGTVSMARTSINMDSASSQFFIVLEDATGLDGGYAAFGRVILGMSAVDRVADTETVGEEPVEKIVISEAYFVSPDNAG